MREPIARFIRQKRAPHGVDAPKGRRTHIATLELTLRVSILVCAAREDLASDRREAAAAVSRRR